MTTTRTCLRALLRATLSFLASLRLSLPTDVSPRRAIFHIGRRTEARRSSVSAMATADAKAAAFFLFLLVVASIEAKVRRHFPKSF